MVWREAKSLWEQASHYVWAVNDQSKITHSLGSLKLLSRWKWMRVPQSGAAYRGDAYGNMLIESYSYTMTWHLPLDKTNYTLWWHLQLTFLPANTETFLQQKIQVKNRRFANRQQEKRAFPCTAAMPKFVCVIVIPFHAKSTRRDWLFRIPVSATATIRDCIRVVQLFVTLHTCIVDMW